MRIRFFSRSSGKKRLPSLLSKEPETVLYYFLVCRFESNVEGSVSIRSERQAAFIGEIRVSGGLELDRGLLRIESRLEIHNGLSQAGSWSRSSLYLGSGHLRDVSR